MYNEDPPTPHHQCYDTLYFTLPLLEWQKALSRILFSRDKKVTCQMIKSAMGCRFSSVEVWALRGCIMALLLHTWTEPSNHSLRPDCALHQSLIFDLFHQSISADLSRPWPLIQHLEQILQHRPVSLLVPPQGSRRFVGRLSAPLFPE